MAARYPGTACEARAAHGAASGPARCAADGTTAYGTRHVPAHRPGQRLAAALLLPGSGPTDRDGDQPPSLQPRTLALVAGVLGDQGIMTLRFDKYASGQTGLGAYAARPGDLDLPAFIKQADAAYALLARLPAGTRVLVTCAAMDVNVPCSTTGPLVAALRQARASGPGLVTLPGLDHLLHPAGTAENDAILAPSAIAALRAFAAPFAG